MRIPWLVLFLVSWIAIPGCQPKKQATELPKPRNLIAIDQVNRSEEQVAELARHLSQLTGGLEAPTQRDVSIFSDRLEYLGVQPVDLFSVAQQRTTSSEHPSSQTVELSSGTRTIDPSQEPVWSEILGTENNFKNCNLGVTGAKFVDEAFVMETLFEGILAKPTDTIVGVKAHQELKWVEVDGDWKLAGWKQQDMELIFSRQPLFKDVTDVAIPDEATRNQAKTYSHWELMKKQASAKTSKLRPASEEYKYFDDWQSSFTYPCISVVDWNQDGWDDLFITDRWAPSQLLQNNGDGTFFDASEDSGLVVDQMAICSLFADFDNDGDQDAFIGGAVTGSRFFEMVDGRYVEDKDPKWKDLKFVNTAAAVDINNDGLLDLYLGTAALGEGPPDAWVPQVVKPGQIEPFKRQMYSSHHFVSRAGLPNFVLMNHSGELIPYDELTAELAQYRVTLQTAWSDLDGDGDMDAYLSNDFSPDVFLRNNTPRGSMTPRFLVSTEAMLADGKMGFGMGSSLGDYNNDGQLDIYVTNMYSKAGTRILKQFPKASQQIKSAAYGNFLYENIGGQFKQVAGTTDGTQKVAKVGWAYGGQFADFDNDTHLDIYVPSGYFTPPEELRKPGDW